MFQGSSVLEKVLGLSRVQIGEKFSCRYLVLGLGFCYSGPLKFWRAFLGWCRVQFSRVLFSEVFLIFQNTFRFFWAIFGLKILFLGLTEKITARELFSADFSFPFSCAFVWVRFLCAGKSLLPNPGHFFKFHRNFGNGTYFCGKAWPTWVNFASLKILYCLVITW